MLTVYRASAGAGKTHKLTGEYLKLLFSHPGAYRRILAVTFTNKATDEMKGRIIEELHLLASNRKSSFVELLSSEHNLSHEAVRREAKKILIRILHDYAAFNISTIDRFFQQTMRAFTREIGLQGGYGIEMDQTMVLTEAVDNLLADLEKPDNKELLSWLLRFADDKIENGGEWNLRREIMSLGQEIFKENYKAFSPEISEDLADKQVLENYKEELVKIVRSVEAEAKRIGEKGLNLMDQYGLKPTDFKGGSRSAMLFFERLANGEMKEPTATFEGFADNPEGCYTKTTPEATRQIISCVMDDGLNDAIKAVLALFSDLSAYYTAREITRYYYTLGILSDISNQIAAYREEKNILLIADTTELLNKIIAGSDAPFIYEKTGTRVDHYMIDEFQDTSKMQWENFSPLLKESLGQAYSNLIVGDVKQSIYRFRNSDWTLLDSQVQHDFSSAELQEETLRDNWRSLRCVVDFNNTFFQNAPNLLQSQYNEQLESSSLAEQEREEFATRINKAYSDSKQETPDHLKEKEGHVQISFLPQEQGSDWKEDALNRLPEAIMSLQDNGYPLKDIAILVRTNLEGAAVAEMLLEYKETNSNAAYKFDIISDDALFVNSSPAVRFIVAILKHLKNPDDQTNRQIAFFSYVALLNSFDEENLDLSFSDEVENALLPLSRLSLYEMSEGIYRLFVDKFPGNEQVFVQAFLDIVLEFSKKENPDIARFLKWWDEAGYKKTIATPNEQDAIRIMTIHKSKGLGFKAVIIPFGDWEIDHKPTKSVILWCHPHNSPFNKLHLVPVRYGQILSKTYFAKDYFKEKLHAFIDNLNTLYVAFTRAKEELIVFSPRPKKAEDTGAGLNKANSISELLWMGLYNELTNDNTISLSSSFDPEEGFFEMGTWYKTTTKDESGDISELEATKFHSTSSKERLHLRLKGKNLSFDDEKRKYGTLMHDLLSMIYTTKDIVPAIESYYTAGIIDQKESSLLKNRLDDYLTKEIVESWYNGSYQTLNETDILFGNGLSRRPDRIMFKDGEVIVVDYKFGEKEEIKYTKQIKAYVDLIEEIGYKQVRGYIWYLELNKLVHVND